MCRDQASPTRFGGTLFECFHILKNWACEGAYRSDRSTGSSRQKTNGSILVVDLFVRSGLLPSFLRHGGVAQPLEDQPSHAEARSPLRLPVHRFPGKRPSSSSSSRSPAMFITTSRRELIREVGVPQYAGRGAPAKPSASDGCWRLERPIPTPSLEVVNIDGASAVGRVRIQSAPSLRRVDAENVQ